MQRHRRVLLGEQWTGDDPSGKSAYWILPTETMSSNVRVWFAFVSEGKRQMQEGNSQVSSLCDLLGATKAGGVVSVHAASEANQGMERVPCCSI